MPARIGEKPAVERFHSGLFAAFSAFFQEMEFELRQQFVELKLHAVFLGIKRRPCPYT